MKSIKQRLLDAEMFFSIACTDYYNDLTQEDIGYIVKKEPWRAAEHLHQHPLLTQKHVGFIVKKEPRYAIEYLSHKFSEKNIAWLAENRPNLLKELFK